MEMLQIAQTFNKFTTIQMPLDSTTAMDNTLNGEVQTNKQDIDNDRYLTEVVQLKCVRSSRYTIKVWMCKLKNIFFISSCVIFVSQVSIFCQ